MSDSGESSQEFDINLRVFVGRQGACGIVSDASSIGKILF